MTFIPTQTGFMRLEDSAKVLRAILPKNIPAGNRTILRRLWSRFLGAAQIGTISDVSDHWRPAVCSRSPGSDSGGYELGNL
jgi:hypothetical protein